MAGIISLLNDYRLSKGEKSLGFLNPWFYSNGLAGLNDIKSGSNSGCSTEGFSAIAEWDPVRPARLVSLHIRGWLTFGSVGDGSRDAGLFGTAGHSRIYGLILGDAEQGNKRKSSERPSDSDTTVPLADYIHVTSRFETPRKSTSKCN